MAAVFQEHHVPKQILSLSTMALPDYVDLFTITTDHVAGGSPEQWARAVVEDSAGRGGQFIWRVVLGLRLVHSPDRIGGWKLADRGSDWLRLEASSRFMTAQIVIQAAVGRLSMATFIRYHNTVASLMWPPLSSIHRHLMPGLLRKAVRTFAARGQDHAH